MRRAAERLYHAGDGLVVAFMLRALAHLGRAGVRPDIHALVVRVREKMDDDARSGAVIFAGIVSELLERPSPTRSHFQ